MEYRELSNDFKKNNITKSIHKTNGRSGLVYLEYWIHNGIEDRENNDINAEFLFEIFKAIKYEISKQTKEDKMLDSLNESSLFPNNLIDKAINQ